MLRKVLNIAFGPQIAKSLLGHLPAVSPRVAALRAERDLIAKEALVGAWVLGDVPAGHTRSFFCLDTHTWVWNEQWHAEDGSLKTMHVQYDVRPDGILKRIDGGHPLRVTGDELRNFDTAVTQYYYQVSSQVYGRTVATA